MKASVITLHSVCNYGTQLQALATQEKLKEYFENVDFINYKRPDTYGRGLIRTFSHGNPIKSLVVLPTILCWKRKFGKFQRKYLNIQKKEYLNDEDFKYFEDTSDIYFSGSDQVWNTGWNNGFVLPFYLNFVPKNKPKYSFSSSFGKNKLDKDEITETKKLLNNYKKITVREDSAVDIVKNQLNYYNVTRILDPTLMFDKNFWEKYVGKRRIKNDYILVYNLNRSKEFDNYAKELSKKTGLKVYRFCTRYDQVLRYGKSLIIPDILDFVTYIYHAKYILTDSFHATAFSLNLNKEPICILPDKFSSRISDFLKLVGCGDRIINDYNDFEVVNRKINFDKVNKLLYNERKKVDLFIRDIIEECKGDKHE